jgi:hypothetical protein
LESQWRGLDSVVITLRVMKYSRRRERNTLVRRALLD